MFLSARHGYQGVFRGDPGTDRKRKNGKRKTNVGARLKRGIHRAGEVCGERGRMK